MQRDSRQFAAAGVQVVGISYDPPAVLKKFAEQDRITYPLLSDPGSGTIDAYHVRNNAARGKAAGVPHPGTFVLDSTGKVRDKLFLGNFRERHTSEALLKAAAAIK